MEVREPPPKGLTLFTFALLPLLLLLLLLRRSVAAVAGLVSDVVVNLPPLAALANPTAVGAVVACGAVAVF